MKPPGTTLRFAPKDAQTRIAARCIPQGAIEERHHDAQAVVYHYAGKQGEPYAIGFAVTAYSPAFHFRFKDEARRAQHVAQWVRGQRASIEWHQERQATTKAATHTLQLGDIVYSSWGYEQTNIDFYQEVRVVSAKTVELRKIEQATVETGFMCGTTLGLKDQFCEDAPVLLRRAVGSSIPNLGRAGPSGSKWDGRDLACSWYA